tara:strand:+ start:191 stop:1081 length:891 start_codon:yes stop_codon:yes gene_type:complete
MSYFDQTTPEYPIISWIESVPAMNIDVTYDGVTEQTSVPASSLWGFATDSSGVADADSLLGYLAEAVQDNLVAEHGIALATVTGGYEWRTDGSEIVLKGKLTLSGFTPATNVVVELDTNHSIFGLEVSGDYTIPSVVSGYSDFSAAGYWAPYNKTVYDDRTFENTSFSAETISGDNLSVVKWGDRKTFRILEFPTVYAAYVYEYRRELAVFSDPAGTNVDDPNNLLINLQTAASATNTNFKLRIYQDDGEYRLGYLFDQELMTSSTGFLEDISARGAMFKVTIPLRDLGDDNTGAV